MPAPRSASILILAFTMPLLSSCDRQEPTLDVDPQVGRECFERHRLSLPPGTQYEGFEAAADRIMIKVMTGAELTSVNCALNPDGTLATQPDPGS